ncbi:MAG: sulfotransferase [Anaerolineales bacterium]|nr:sulfotransferase [Anaerolineales bacterium]
MNTSSQKEVIILGMHRSGTSMVGGVLSHLGVDMGDDFPGKQISNPLGHFEDGDFLTLNSSILEQAGGDWKTPPSYQQILSQEKTFQPQILALVRSRQKQNPQHPWGWKDPRTSLTIELYKANLHNPFFIWCQRAPEDIAESLWQRNGIVHADGLKLVDIYEQGIQEFFNKYPEMPKLILNFQEVVNQPQYWVNALIDFLELDPEREDINQAIAAVLPHDKIEREKTIWRWKYWFSLPYRAIKKIFCQQSNWTNR